MNYLSVFENIKHALSLSCILSPRTSQKTKEKELVIFVRVRVRACVCACVCVCLLFSEETLHIIFLITVIIAILFAGYNLHLSQLSLPL